MLEKLLKRLGPLIKVPGAAEILHMDSWEMGSQNWTALFRQEFTKRRGYDPLPFYPVYAGNIIESKEISERFLWDLRQTSQELFWMITPGRLRNTAIEIIWDCLLSRMI